MSIGPSRPLVLEKPDAIDLQQAARYFGQRGPADLRVHTGAEGHGQQNGMAAAGQVAEDVLPQQKPGLGKALHIPFQPDGAGCGRRQNGHGTSF